MKTIQGRLWLILGMMTAPVLAAVPAGSEAMAIKNAWVREHWFEPGVCDLPGWAAEASDREPGLDVYANNDPVIANRRGDAPLHIGDRTYQRGLYCHAQSKVAVRLDGPGERFVAEVGLDRNDDTLRGRGSVVFRVMVNGEAAFTSEIMRVDSPPCPVEVALDGASEFVLEIGDVGDGIGWDQSDWADARVVMRDGREVWLGEMPIRDRRNAGAITPIARSSRLPIAFVYGERRSDELVGSWPQESRMEQLDANRTKMVRTWREPGGGLEIRVEAVNYGDYPAVEWTVYFKNDGKQDTAILKNIQALDCAFGAGRQEAVRLHAWKGDTCAPDLYEPIGETLGAGKTRRFAPADGRGTNHAFPYYHIQWEEGGLLLAVGWPGQWATQFEMDEQKQLRIMAGQEMTHLRLRPGEEIRTPLIAMLFWRGKETSQGQNLWRRWMWDYNVPRTADGKLPEPILFGNTSGIFYEMIHANEDNQKQFIDRYVEKQIGITYWWMDAGWYPCEGEWPRTGTWEPDPARFPNGLRAISDHAREQGIKTLVWFEPERVGGGWLSQHHPEWRLGPLLNLGNREAWNWLVNHIDGQINSQGIDLYRQDFNMSPLGYWRGNDGPDRQGITENLHVQGYLGYWDELRRRHPQLLIDSCASGGRRNDLETMRRAVPLHPTDYNYGDLTAKQAFHHSLFQWIPFYGSNTVPMESVDPYAIGSGLAMGVVFGYEMRREDLDYGLLKKLADQWRAIQRYYYGDYYPVLPYSRSDQDWIGWQFHLSEENAGMIQAFRRPQCEVAGRELVLSGLTAGRMYEFRKLDSGQCVRLSGQTAMEKGVPVTIDEKPGAIIWCYQAVDEGESEY